MSGKNSDATNTYEEFHLVVAMAEIYNYDHDIQKLNAEFPTFRETIRELAELSEIAWYTDNNAFDIKIEKEPATLLCRLTAALNRYLFLTLEWDYLAKFNQWAYFAAINLRWWEQAFQFASNLAWLKFAQNYSVEMGNWIERARTACSYLKDPIQHTHLQVLSEFQWISLANVETLKQNLEVLINYYETVDVSSFVFFLLKAAELFTRRSGHPELVKGYYSKALEKIKELNLTFYEAECYCSFGWRMLAEDKQIAKIQFEKAVVTAKKYGLKHVQVSAYLGLSRLHDPSYNRDIITNDREQALHFAKEALEIEEIVRSWQYDYVKSVVKDLQFPPKESVTIH
jgi:hypothetical protein